MERLSLIHEKEVFYLDLFLGVDPSTSNTGLAIVDKNKKVYYVLDKKGRAEDPIYFHELYQTVDALIVEYKVKAIAVEDQFMSRNPDTLKKLARLGGIFMALAGKHELPLYLQIPASWRKRWVLESGIQAYHDKDSFKKKASYSKEECFYILQLYFPTYLHDFKKDNDKADALGIAWACSQIYQEGGLVVPIKKKKKKKAS